MADAAVGFLVIPNVIALFLLRKDFIDEYQKFKEGVRTIESKECIQRISSID